MDNQQAFLKLKDFFETRKACQVAADPLRKNVEIGILINGALSCAFFKENSQPKFEQRDAKNPDVIFHLNSAAVEKLVNHQSDDVAELGINIARSYLDGDVKIKVKGSMINLLTNGYLGVIKSGGLSFTKFLATHGISGLGRIKDVIQKFREK